MQIGIRCSPVVVEIVGVLLRDALVTIMLKIAVRKFLTETAAGIPDRIVVSVRNCQRISCIIILRVGMSLREQHARLQYHLFPPEL